MGARSEGSRYPRLPTAAESANGSVDGRTPLSWAASQGYVAVARLLLDKGAALEARDRQGQTPLIMAALNGHEAVVRLLVDKGASLDAKDQGGRTPLAVAVERKHEAVAAFLVDSGAASRKAPDEVPRPSRLPTRLTIMRLLGGRDTAEESSHDHDGKTTVILAKGQEMMAKLLGRFGDADQPRDRAG